MPRKTKEINEEIAVKKQTKSAPKIETSIENVISAEEKVVADKKTVKTKTKSASTAKSKAKTKADKSSSTKKEPKTTTKSKAKVATPKKTTKAKSSVKNKEEKATKKTTEKTEKKTKEVAKTKTAAKTKSSKTKSIQVAAPTVVEYYDLPYRYNQTVVKVLYQNPTTLFVYWEISDSDIENFKKQYGENFFETTKPVLVVYSVTMNYHFEIDINDFANSWYFNINDSKCDYRVELIRKPISYNPNIKADRIQITYSNNIESPNDKILFSTDEPYTVYFRNIKNNSQRKVNLPKLLEQLNLANKGFGFPIIGNVYDLYKNIYNIEDVGEFSISLTNPSSGNPSSHSLSSRFI